DLSGLRLAALEIVDQGHAVNLGSLSRHTRFPQKIGLLRKAGNQHGNFRAHHPAIARPRDLALDRHQAALAVLDCAPIDLRIELVAFARILVGMGEDAEIVEFRGFDELTQLLEIRSRLARKTDDEAGSDRHSGYRPADALQQFEKDFAVRPPL